jgi:hypothetical protein
LVLVWFQNVARKNEGGEAVKCLLSFATFVSSRERFFQGSLTFSVGKLAGLRFCVPRVPENPLPDEPETRNHPTE